MDKDTSGLLVVVKNDWVHHRLLGSLKVQQVRKGYMALAEGRLTDNKWVVNLPIGRHPRNQKKMEVVENGKAMRTHLIRGDRVT